MKGQHPARGLCWVYSRLLASTNNENSLFGKHLLLWKKQNIWFNQIMGKISWPFKCNILYLNPKLNFNTTNSTSPNHSRWVKTTKDANNNHSYFWRNSNSIVFFFPVFRAQKEINDMKWVELECTDQMMSRFFHAFCLVIATPAKIFLKLKSESNKIFRIY